ncbi:hypothetical protein D3C86_2175640 [compost metagenome]
MPSAAGETGLNTIYIQVVAPQQTVAVHLTDLVEGKLFLFMQRIFVRYVTNQCLP